jgi:hypothetical protein
MHTTKEGVGSANHTKALPKRSKKGREKSSNVYKSQGLAYT